MLAGRLPAHLHVLVLTLQVTNAKTSPRLRLPHFSRRSSYTKGSLLPLEGSLLSCEVKLLGEGPSL